ncbi:hypothetical protein BRADI_3g53265v3 [Brachypodium distachyon]|uniref:Secreted protein n=1 Tax=Brachypodium distachyon TaxID=15368 RepID=A0A0Q3JR79_BRADI|nr:hypothetical protein BRADI_3g53265v3 [Brachypodium distachyon]
MLFFSDVSLSLSLFIFSYRACWSRASYLASTPSPFFSTDFLSLRRSHPFSQTPNAVFPLIQFFSLGQDLKGENLGRNRKVLIRLWIQRFERPGDLDPEV